jgi:hypothetical protein
MIDRASQRHDDAGATQRFRGGTLDESGIIIARALSVGVRSGDSGAIGLVEDEEAPRMQESVIRSSVGRGQQRRQLRRVRTGCFEARNGATVVQELEARIEGRVT